LRDREDVRIWRWNDIKNSSRVDEVGGEMDYGGTTIGFNVRLERVRISKRVWHELYNSDDDCFWWVSCREI